MCYGSLNGHKTLHLENASSVRTNLIIDYAAWVPYYKKRHHWIRRIFDNRKKAFIRMLKLYQANLFTLYPTEIYDMIQKAVDVVEN